MDLVVQIVVAVFMVLVIALTANLLVLMSIKEVIVPIVRIFLLHVLAYSYPAFTFSKLTIETLEQGVEYVIS